MDTTADDGHCGTCGGVCTNGRFCDASSCVCAAPISATPTRITTTAAFDGGVQLALGAGEVGAVWSATIATGSSIVFQRWAVDGMPLAVAIPLRTMPPGEGISGIDIAWNGAMWGVTWMETVGPIGARVSTTHFARLSPTGTMIGAPVDLTDGDFVGAAVLGWSPSLGFVAALSSRAAAFFRVIGADGSAPLLAVRYRPTSGIGAVGRDLVTAPDGTLGFMVRTNAPVAWAMAIASADGSTVGSGGLSIGRSDNPPSLIHDGAMFVTAGYRQVTAPGGALHRQLFVGRAGSSVTIADMAFFMAGVDGSRELFGARVSAPAVGPLTLTSPSSPGGDGRPASARRPGDAGDLELTTARRMG